MIKNEMAEAKDLVSSGVCGQGGNKCKPNAAQGTQSGRQVWETSARQVGDMWETNVNSCGQRHPEWETRGRQV